jgi:HEPN domain-containing protein
VQEVQDTHPRTHDLVKIAKQSNISISEDNISFLFDMNQFNIEARYPEYKSLIKKKADKNFTHERMLKTKDFYQWLKSIKK